MIRRIFASLLFLAALAGCQTTGLDDEQTPRSRYAGREGELPVGVIPEGVLRDTARDRDVLMSIDYPSRGGNYPLLMFSHGLGSSHRAYVSLASFWASQGYVVIRVGHADAGRMQNISSGEAAWQTQTAAEWRNRVRDVTFVLDSLAQLRQAYPELEGKIDETKIGVGGHGYGAFTAMLLGGLRTFPGAVSYADPRVKAVLAMSPFGPGPLRGLTTESWQDLETPTLFMVGSDETGVNDTETAQWRQEAFRLAPAGDKWLFVLEGARSSTFTGVYQSAPSGTPRSTDRDATGRPLDPNRPPPMDPRQGRESYSGVRERSLFNRIQGVSLSFWDAYLLGTAEGRQALEGAATEKK